MQALFQAFHASTAVGVLVTSPSLTGLGPTDTCLVATFLLVMLAAVATKLAALQTSPLVYIVVESACVGFLSLAIVATSMASRRRLVLTNASAVVCVANLIVLNLLQFSRLACVTRPRENHPLVPPCSV
ncbi:Aste57867_10133 [Aphanomyces stellatus]|uniref:Aste57867_10133 protein n=1 Tax=Aphanomyces stellatus TaxID=120398 RepID=A0A485KPL2_9STRA|nr:hypothetical protein As57867_010094 [Aphanomyces stellatus]VFT87009.1 Aste57867_10133 [Aphanomyces stellatus]